MTPTRGDFVITYQKMVVATYPWAANKIKLDAFINAVVETIATDKTGWAWDNAIGIKTWRIIHGGNPPTRYTLKALRALPPGDMFPCLQNDEQRADAMAALRSWLISRELNPRESVLLMAHMIGFITMHNLKEGATLEGTLEMVDELDAIVRRGITNSWKDRDGL